MEKLFQTPRGTRDILPDDQIYWQFVKGAFQKKCETFGCGRIDTPIFEYADVFTKGLGESSDIVTKEMFEVRRVQNVETKLEEEEKRLLIMRPEITASIMRAYVQHGMKIWPQPVKLYYEGPCFRYERPQAGRFRQFNQFGVEIIGDASPLMDASLIYLAWQIMEKIGMGDSITIDINSVGCPVCRPKIRKKLVEYFEKFLPDLCADCNRRYTENPLRILDCKNESCQKIVANAPQIIESICPECKAHFKEVLETLDSLQISYNLNSRLVRGLDYYTKTVFEIYETSDERRQATLLGGGRYDGLLKLFGEEQTPAVGFSAGLERLIEKVKEKNIEIPIPKMADVCIAKIGDKAQKKCLELVGELEKEGIEAACILGKESLKSQLRTASRMGVKYCLIIGQKEVLDKSLILRNMDDSSQETIKMTRLLEVLKQKLN
jgi:histidyl-tRNA synthetase